MSVGYGSDQGYPRARTLTPTTPDTDTAGLVSDEDALKLCAAVCDLADNVEDWNGVEGATEIMVDFARTITTLRTITAERDALREAVKAALNFLDSAPLESGFCCCGDPIDGHGYHSGHSPVDDLAYHASKVADELRATLKGNDA